MAVPEWKSFSSNRTLDGPVMEERGSYLISQHNGKKGLK
jgi:hypothetical protein